MYESKLKDLQSLHNYIDIDKLPDTLPNSIKTFLTKRTFLFMKPHNTGVSNVGKIRYDDIKTGNADYKKIKDLFLNNLGNHLIIVNDIYHIFSAIACDQAGHKKYITRLSYGDDDPYYRDICWLNNADRLQGALDVVNAIDEYFNVSDNNLYTKKYPLSYIILPTDYDANDFKMISYKVPNWLYSAYMTNTNAYQHFDIDNDTNYRGD